MEEGVWLSLTQINRASSKAQAVGGRRTRVAPPRTCGRGGGAQAGSRASWASAWGCGLLGVCVGGV